MIWPIMILGWPGTEASIPSGWSRRADLDGLYLRGSTETGNGGEPVHQHAVPAHGHSGAGHDHTGYTNWNADANRLENGAVAAYRQLNHQHQVNVPSVIETVYDAAFGITGFTNNAPPWWEMIWISPDDYAIAGAPAGAIGFWTQDTVPTGWVLVGQERFLKGAAGGVGGGTTGGSTTHSHVGPIHTHLVEHTHGTFDTLDAAIGNEDNADVTPLFHIITARTHHHELTIGLHTSTSPNHMLDIDPASSMPPYKKIGIIRNDSGAASMPVGLVVALRNLYPDYPYHDGAGWRVCDGTNGTMDFTGNVFLLGCTDLAGDLGNVGGAATHEHNVPAHFHSYSHQHSGADTGTNSSDAIHGYVDPNDELKHNAHYHYFYPPEGTITLQEHAAMQTYECSYTPLPPYANVTLMLWAGPEVIAADQNLFGQSFRAFCDVAGDPLKVERRDRRDQAYAAPVSSIAAAWGGDIECLPDGRLRVASRQGSWSGLVGQRFSYDDGRTWVDT